MAKQMVNELQPNQTVDAPFVVKDKSLRTFRNKEGQYLALTIGDRTGEISARVWDNAEQVASSFKAGEVIQVQGRVEEYQGQSQIIVQRLRPLGPSEYDKADFVKASARPPAEMLQQLRENIQEIGEPNLKALCEAVFDDEEILSKFAQVPGAKALHHAYVGGLLEHTLNVTEIVKTAARLHPDLNRDLLVAAALLHDLGKIDELAGEMAIDYTDLGNFVGHVVLTDRIVNQKIAELPDFPEQLAALLTHMLLSHHGEREWGAPITPATPEACALHYADNLDARVEGYQAFRQQQADQEGQWARHWMFDRNIYLGPTGLHPDRE